jgi:acyl carrier protein
MSESAKLDGAIRTALGLPDGSDVTGIAYGKTEGWDSVAHMQLVAAIENALGIMIETDDVIAMSDYAAVRSILREHHGIALEP